ncbi:MAG: hypothetical protein ABR540_18645 [Acidimicrobiales bacterium]
MSTGVRLTLAGLSLVVAAIVVGTMIIPTHVTFGAGSLRCGTVLRPERNSEVAPLCDRVAQNHLRAVLVIGAVLAAIALAPLVVASRRPGRHVALAVGWAVTMVLATIVAVAVMGWVVEYAPDSIFFDL